MSRPVEFRDLPAAKTRRGKLYDGRTHEAVAEGAKQVWKGLKWIGKQISKSK